MKISDCLTIFNEFTNLSELILSILPQISSESEIVIVDSNSVDGTAELLDSLQKKDKKIIVVKEKCSRTCGRNLSVKLAKNNIIVMTDAGCIPRKNWLKNLTIPFNDKNIDVVAGFYHMTYRNLLGKVESFFLGTLPNKFLDTFIPSTRSMAFRKEIWEKVGGFDEHLDDAAEDTLFNFKLIENKAKFARVKNAVVEWGMPKTLKEYFKKIFNYAKSDVKTKIWVFPGKGVMSHNIKSLLVLARYAIFLGLFILSIVKFVSPVYFVIIFFAYIYYVYRKIYIAFGELNTALLGILVQFITDFAVISGFLYGLIC